MYVAPEVHFGGKFDTFLSAPGPAIMRGFYTIPYKILLSK